MKLAQFIQRNIERILEEWESFARTLLPAAASMSKTTLRDHARQILLAVATDMDTHQSEDEQKEKSRGQGPKPPAGSAETAATTHGGLRHEGGFDLVQLVAEYRALRASVLRLWTKEGSAAGPQDLEDVIRFNEAIDQAIAESVARFADEISRTRDTFTAILGHDLRSPLGAIAMSAHNAASCELPETAARSILIIQRSAKVMQAMIRDLLDFAGTGLGREMPMRFQDGNLLETCHSALAELMAAHPRRIFQFEHDGDLRTSFDPERIGQALSNLLNNAINHGDPDRPVAMRVRTEPQDLVVDVVNEGRTVPPDVLQAAMEPASRGGMLRSEGSSGLGLGLYIAQQVAKAHGGTVTAASHDKKTRFSLRLPRKHQGQALPMAV